MTALVTQSAETILAPVDGTGAARQPILADLQQWAIEMERAVDAVVQTAPVFTSKAAADLSLAWAANTMGWVIADSNPALVGLYQKQGASGTGAWVRVGPLPYNDVNVQLAIDAAAAAVAAANSLGGLFTTSYATRAIAIASSIPVAATYIRTAGYATVGDGGDALYRRVASEPTHGGKFQSLDGAWWELVKPDELRVEVFGAFPGVAASQSAAIQAAIDYLYDTGGGTLKFGVGIYQVLIGLNVWHNVTLKGVFPGFLNQYSSTAVLARGSVLFLIAGSTDTAIVRFQMRAYNDGGTIRETGTAVAIQDYRHHGGAQDLVIWGNRSANGAVRTAVDRNSTSNGIVVNGSRYVRIKNVISMMCGKDGFLAQSLNYGAGAISTNNLEVDGLTVLNNAEVGFEFFGGDSNVFGVNAGYNGLSGINVGFSGPLNGCLSWNNGAHGIVVQGTPRSGGMNVTGCYSYDNDWNGFDLTGDGGVAVSGCVSRGNGMGAGATDLSRCNYLVRAGARSVSITGCMSNSLDYLGNNPTRYGYYISNSTHKVAFAGNHSDGTFGISALTVTNPANLLAPQAVV